MCVYTEGIIQLCCVLTKHTLHIGAAAAAYAFSDIRFPRSFIVKDGMDGWVDVCLSVVGEGALVASAMRCYNIKVTPLVTALLLLLTHSLVIPSPLLFSFIDLYCTRFVTIKDHCVGLMVCESLPCSALPP